MYYLAVIFVVKIILLYYFVFIKYLQELSISEDFLSNMDFSVDPCDNFYQFSCGGWVESFQLPSSEFRWVKSFKNISEENVNKISTIISQASNPVIKNFYDSCKNIRVIHMSKIKLLDPIYSEIETTIRSIQGNTNKMDKILQLIAKLHSYGFNPLFYFGSEADRDNPNVMISFIGQYGSYLLPKVYYKNKELLLKYENHIYNMMKMLYNTETDDNVIKDYAKSMIKIEKFFSAIGLLPVELRDPYLTWNKKTINQISSMTKVNFNMYLNEIKRIYSLDNINHINVHSTKYFSNVFEYVKNNITNNEFEVYLKWIILHSVSPYVNKEYRLENFDFFRKILFGQQEPKERNKFCQDSFEVGGSIGYLLGKYYVEKYFPPKSKEKVIGMIGNIQNTFKEDILDELTWMDDETKQTAYKKLNKITNMIGYPDKFDVYYKGISDKNISAGSVFLKNILFLKKYEKMREIVRIGKNVEMSDWEMTPQTVNAYYEPLKNQMVFPAGILQPPFFSNNFPKSLLYGGLGMVLSHELSHGFDDEGSKFDEKGMLNNWWSEKTKEKWNEKINCIKNQYAKYSPFPEEEEEEHYVNGNLTSGENIADSTGLKISYLAYKREIGEGKLHKRSSFTGKLTNIQLFYVQFAQLWCYKATRESIIQRIEIDPHSPPNLRVLGAVSNSEYFQDAFSCNKNTKYNPLNKCNPY